MTWVAPPTLAVGDPGTTAYLNAYVRDNTNFLASSKLAGIATSDATASTSYTDLGTFGPQVSLVTGGGAIVIICADMNNTGANTDWVAVEVSGASTVAATDPNAVKYFVPTAGGASRLSALVTLAGLIAGVNIFTAKYRTSGGTATFQNREIAVFPIP